MKKSIRVPVPEIAADIKNGLPDAQLMKKYGLSNKGLKKVFDKLLRAMANGWHHIEVESEG